MNHKQNEGKKKDFKGYSLSSKEDKAVSQSRNHGGMMLPGQAQLPRDYIAHIGLGPPSSTSSFKKTLQICPKGVLKEAIPELRFPLPRYACLCEADNDLWQEFKFTMTYLHAFYVIPLVCPS